MPAVLYAARVAASNACSSSAARRRSARLAYGTRRVPKVDKIFGPGNTWVTEAKDQVERDPAGAARDYPAGPSEVLVIADERPTRDSWHRTCYRRPSTAPIRKCCSSRPAASSRAPLRREVERQKARLTRRALVEGALAHRQ